MIFSANQNVFCLDNGEGSKGRKDSTPINWITLLIKEVPL